jgi:hypothetical protein
MEEQVSEERAGAGEEGGAPDRPAMNGRESEPLAEEERERLLSKARTLNHGRGYPLAEYDRVVSDVAETGVVRTNLERDFPNVSPKHLAYVMRKRGSELKLPITVAEDDARGVCVFRIAGVNENVPA